METTVTTDPQTLSMGLLIGRLVLGLLMAAHGAQKLFGWFGGYGLTGTGEFLAQMGWRPGRLFATLSSVAEIVSGLLVALGFLGPIGPAIMIAVMIVAAISVHWQHGLFATSNGIELPLLYATGALALAFTGYGRYSLDAALGLTPAWTPAVAWGAVAAGVVGGIVNLALRRPAPTVPSV
jgi:putative oxidoreductase